MALISPSFLTREAEARTAMTIGLVQERGFTYGKIQE